MGPVDGATECINWDRQSDEFDPVWCCCATLGWHTLFYPGCVQKYEIGCADNSYGCMDPTYDNYDAGALFQEAGTCQNNIEEIYGCTEAGATNFNSLATSKIDPVNGMIQCIYAYPGCTDSMADNYIASTDVDDGSCTYSIPVDAFRQHISSTIRLPQFSQLT